jgi:N-acetylmuramoyl-L-alanine amidase CwlA
MLSVKAPYAMNPQYLTIHNTGNTASAINEANYMNGNWNQVSYHVVIDENFVIQLIPFTRNAWHAGDGQGTGNRRSIGIEIARSMDNGYSGSMSERYLQAQENAALYRAYVLIQYGWGTDRLRQHWHWSRKDCPHKMRAHGYWDWFVRRVQQHMNAIKNGKSTGKTKPTKTAPKANAQKAKNGSYKVKKGDTLWGIATANNTTVDALKQLNNLKSANIKPGQTLTVKKVSKSIDRASWGYHWSGTFTADADIAIYRGDQHMRPHLQVSDGLKKGQYLNFDHLFINSKGYWILRVKYAQPGSSNDYHFMPVGKKKTGETFEEAIKNGSLWGKVTKLNTNEKTSGVTNWHKKESVK